MSEEKRESAAGAERKVVKKEVSGCKGKSRLANCVKRLILYKRKDRRKKEENLQKEGRRAPEQRKACLPNTSAEKEVTEDANSLYKPSTAEGRVGEDRIERNTLWKRELNRSKPKGKRKKSP